MSLWWWVIYILCKKKNLGIMTFSPYLANTDALFKDLKTLPACQQTIY